jgi:hypothetical protein
MAFRTLPAGASLPAAARRPRLMAVGDSLFNGTRSLSQTDHLARFSIPAVVADHMPHAFGPFRAARYPREVLIDLERELSQFDQAREPLSALVEHLPQIMKRVQLNALAWLDDFRTAPAQPVFFDNLSIAGAAIPEVFDLSVADCERRLAAMEPVVRASAELSTWSGPPIPGDPVLDQTGWRLIDLHVAINARHLLNPGDSPMLREMRPIDLVALREPRVLLVNLGANHGLFDYTMNGEPERGLQGLDAFARRWEDEIAATLADLPASIERVVVGLMPRPSQVPNLMPPVWHRGPDDLPDSDVAGYFGFYTAVLRTDIDRSWHYTGAQLRDIDAEVEAIRRRVRAATQQAFAARGRGGALRFLDLAEVIGANDQKNGRGPALTVNGVGAPRDFTNRAFGWHPTKGTLRGGACSWDNHHPTLLGYQRAAQAVQAQLGAAFVEAPIQLTDRNDDILQAPGRTASELLRTLHALHIGASVPQGASSIAQAHLLFDPEFGFLASLGLATRALRAILKAIGAPGSIGARA